VIGIVATDVTINYLPPEAVGTLAASPPNEYTLHAERLPIVCLCTTPDNSTSGTLMLAQALIDNNAVVPPQLLLDLTPDWFPQTVIDLLQRNATIF
jgi:hypothetical protein